VKRIAIAVLVAVAAAAAGGCGYESQGEAGGRPLALTTFTVTADMVRNVAGNRVEVASITKPGAEIHGYEPTPSDLKRGARADIIFDNGMGLERWFDQFIDEADAPRVTLSTGVRSIPIAGASDYEGKPNPHAWMSPANARVYVENIRKGLTRLDPAGAAYFRRNAERYSRELTRVHEDLERELASVPRSRRALVTCEGAFSYLARDTGMKEHYLFPVNAEQEGTPKQIASVVEAVRRDRIPVVFCESTLSDKPQRQVARESGARFGGELYVDSLSKPDGPVPTYLELLRRDARTIVDGLKGGGGV